MPTFGKYFCKYIKYTIWKNISRYQLMFLLGRYIIVHTYYIITIFLKLNFELI